MYATLDEYRAYADRLGQTVPADDATATIQLEKASDYIESKEPYLKGTRSERDQDYAYPRKDLVINGYSYTSEEIPPLVKNCQMALALEINDGVDLYKLPENLPVIKKRVEGVVEKQFAAPSRVQTRERQSVAVSLLKQLMNAPGVSIPLERR